MWPFSIAGICKGRAFFKRYGNSYSHDLLIWFSIFYEISVLFIYRASLHSKQLFFTCTYFLYYIENVLSIYLDLIQFFMSHSRKTMKQHVLPFQLYKNLIIKISYKCIVFIVFFFFFLFSHLMTWCLIINCSLLVEDWVTHCLFYFILFESS